VGHVTVIGDNNVGISAQSGLLVAKVFFFFFSKNKSFTNVKLLDIRFYLRITSHTFHLPTANVILKIVNIVLNQENLTNTSDSNANHTAGVHCSGSSFFILPGSTRWTKGGPSAV
jgi:hypothetical protein